MKKIILTLLVLVTSVAGVQAQKFRYVDTDYILSQMPEYTGAQKQLDELSAKWEKEIADKKAIVDKMYRDYTSEEVLLTPAQKKERQDAIVAKEDEYKKAEQDKFGYEGELFKKRQELIKPIQDKVFSAIQKVAKENVLDFVFDKSSNMNMLFTNPKYDISGEVLDELGVVDKGDSNDSGTPKKGK
ncbi:MAG: OmpH family outer membrane protein [Bacteroidia bacterium]|nr:OmpH family outer membrane protein [Bacteroidia bacterium]